MPAQFTLPPDTRAVGTGNPPADMNGVIDAVTADGVTYNVLNATYSGGADPTGVADSQPAFQAAVNAAVAATGAEVIIPPGIYKLNSAVSITGPFRMRGLGQGQGINENAIGSAPNPAAVLNASGGNVFTFPTQAYLWGGLEMENFAVSYTGAGSVFSVPSITNSTWRNLTITLTQSGSTAYAMSGASPSFLNNTLEHVTVITTNATRSSPMITITSGASGAISNTTFFRCKFNNAGLDNTQYMIHIACTGAGVAYHFFDNIRDCWFEHPYGGAVRTLSGQNCTIDGCAIWDIFSGSGNTVGNSLYYIGAFAGNSGSQGTTISNCGRNRNGPNGSTTWDVYAEATSSQTLVTGYTVKADTASTATNAFFNFNGHPDVTLINNLSPQGASVNGNSTTVVTNPSPLQVTIGSGAVAAATILGGGPWAPQDSNWLEFNYDPGPVLISTGTALATAGKVNLIRIPVRAVRSITNVIYYLGAAGSVLTSGQCFAGLYTSAGVLIGATADQAANWGASFSAGVKVVALASGPFTVQPGFMWLALLFNGTTGPSFGSTANFRSDTANPGLGVGVCRYGTASPVTQTSLPGSFTPSANSLSQVTYWGAVS